MRISTVKILALCALLVGCDDAAMLNTNRQFVRYNVGGSSVKEFQLNDGTRCVLYVGANVTCEWQQPVVLAPRVE